MPRPVSCPGCLRLFRSPRALNMHREMSSSCHQHVVMRRRSKDHDGTPLLDIGSMGGGDATVRNNDLLETDDETSTRYLLLFDSDGGGGNDEEQSPPLGLDYSNECSTSRPPPRSSAAGLPASKRARTNPQQRIVELLSNSLYAEALQPDGDSDDMQHNSTEMMDYEVPFENLDESDQLTKDDATMVELLELLQASGAPLSMFDSIMKWATRSQTLHQYDFSQQHPSRQCFMKHLQDTFNMSNMKPMATNVSMLGGGSVSIPVFDFATMLVDLVNDPRVSPHLNINWNDTCKSVSGTDRSKYGDVHTGKWHVNTQKKQCLSMGDVLAGIILFIDRTHIDANGRCTVEPIVFTLSIIPLHLRNHVFAWRPLAYLKDPSAVPSVVNRTTVKGQNMNNYHRMVFAALQSLVRCQHKGGVHVKLRPNRNAAPLPIVLKVPIAFVIGDCEGLDKLCGRYGSWGAGVQCVSRQCKCPLLEADDEDHECVYTTMNEIEQLVRSRDHDGLSNLSYHYHYNGFRHCDFGENPRGIQGACPSETMHALQQGLFEYAIRSLFALLSTPELAFLEDIVNDIRNEASRQSDRNLPHVSMSVKLTNMKKVTAQDVTGILFLLTLALYTDATWNNDDLDSFAFVRSRRDGTVVSRTPTENHQNKQRRIKELRQLFELLLIVAYVLDQPELSKNLVNSGGLLASCRAIVRMFREGVKREEGNGTRLAKLHHILHLPDDCKMFGSPINWKGARPETNHKKLAKDPARHTQKRHDTIDHQTAVRYTEFQAVDRAAVHLEIRTGKLQHVAHSRESGALTHTRRQRKEAGGGRAIGGTKFSIYWNGNSDRIGISWPSQRKGRQNTVRIDPKECVLDALRQILLPSLVIPPGAQKRTFNVSCFTEHTRPGSNILFRASTHYHGRSWNDWAVFDWGAEDGAIPGRIEFFVDFRSDSSHLSPNGDIDSDLYALVNSLEKEPTDLDPSHVLGKGKLEKNVWHLVPVDSIMGTCFVISNETTKRSSVGSVLIVKAREGWGVIF